MSKKFIYVSKWKYNETNCYEVGECKVNDVTCRVVDCDGDFAEWYVYVPTNPMLYKETHIVASGSIPNTESNYFDIAQHQAIDAAKNYLYSI